MKLSVSPTLQVPTGAMVVPRDPVGGRGAETLILLSVVVPTYNERCNLLPLVTKLTAVLESIVGNAYEIIVVDDDSPDRTYLAVEELASTYPRLKLLHRKGVRDLSTAVVRGWQAASGEVLGVIDGDLQHPPEVIADLWSEIKEGADVAVGSRLVGDGETKGLNPARKLVSRAARLIGLTLLPSIMSRTSDPMSGLFLIRRSAIAGCVLDPLGYKILVEALARGRAWRVADVPFVFQDRHGGQTKFNWRVSAEYLEHLIRLRLFLWNKSISK